MNKTLKFLLLIPISAATLFFLYPILHELGHAIVTWILGGQVSAFSFTPLPHIDSGLPYDAPEKIAAVSLAGIIFPLILCLPFMRLRRYAGFTIMLILLITAISSTIELCIAIQYQLGDTISGDDIVLFLSTSHISPSWAYVYCSLICIASLLAVVYMQPIQLIEDLATQER